MAADQRICRQIVSGNGKAQIKLYWQKILKSNGLAETAGRLRLKIKSDLTLPGDHQQKFQNDAECSVSDFYLLRFKL